MSEESLKQVPPKGPLLFREAPEYSHRQRFVRLRAMKPLAPMLRIAPFSARLLRISLCAGCSALNSHYHLLLSLIYLPVPLTSQPWFSVLESTSSCALIRRGLGHED